MLHIILIILILMVFLSMFSPCYMPGTVELRGDEHVFT